eukprot:2130387-Pleurochrysis_carterae.AAC.1
MEWIREKPRRDRQWYQGTEAAREGKRRVLRIARSTERAELATMPCGSMELMRLRLDASRGEHG